MKIEEFDDLVVGTWVLIMTPAAIYLLYWILFN